MAKFSTPFAALGIPDKPIILAPLAGVSDHPFRRVCTGQGADLTYVEMISATALIYQSKRTFEMLARHEDERILGVQVTGPDADQTAQAFAILEKEPFDTIDINMGCPVSKVVKTGCGSAILKDPERVFETVKACRNETDKPFSAKIRLGWDHAQVNGVEVAQAIEAGGADWLVVHGRTRSDDYSVPVDLDELRRIRASVHIPMIGNGNIFSGDDGEYMMSRTGVAGVMVSRGALGNPWSFASLKGREQAITPEEWGRVAGQHLRWQLDAYGEIPRAAVCMRKHLLWYCKGWPGIKAWKDEITRSDSLAQMLDIVERITGSLQAQGHKFRDDVGANAPEKRFQWDPKWEMDRKLDRGVGTDMMGSTPEKAQSSSLQG